ncbi:salivary C-type lectin 2-like [Rhynchophorus ferrugineus]|uniref:salivary C-type lectin 2-like n=1 Tax=Rhynchophorus ferrugineus TaxID=354439 RepID=UPI003FCDF7FA
MKSVAIILANILLIIATTSANKYVISNQKVTFHDGYLRCIQYGLDPAEVLSEADEIELEEALKPFKEIGALEGIWIFSSNTGNKTNFFWLNSNLPLFYSKFSVGQPNGVGYSCLEIYQSNTGVFFWNDLACETKLRFVCQRKQNDNMCSDNQVGTRNHQD